MTEFLGESFPLKTMQDTVDETSDETLSLCDLPLYSNPSFEQWEDDLFDESQAGSTSISSSENNYFEFLSQELNPPRPENIIFCGKIIPYKGDVSMSKEVEIKKQTSIKKKRGWGVFGWKFSFGRSSKTQVQSKDDHQRPPMKKHNNNNKHEFPLHKMPILASTSSGKARWHMLLFGISRISSGVELRDIKSRQSRRHSPSPSPPHGLRDEEVGGGTNGLWGLIKVLSCGGNNDPTDMIVGSINRSRIE
ncbi:hypothetical protein ACS0TY_000570 [Phlomoides rotata]